MEEAAPPAAPRPLLSNGRGTPSVGRKAVATAAGATCDKNLWEFVLGFVSGRGSGSREFCLTSAEASSYDLQGTLAFSPFLTFIVQSFTSFILNENSESVSYQ